MNDEDDEGMFSNKNGSSIDHYGSSMHISYDFVFHALFDSIITLKTESTHRWVKINHTICCDEPK